jgi:hypothetical protein
MAAYPLHQRILGSLNRLLAEAIGPRLDGQASKVDRPLCGEDGQVIADTGLARPSLGPSEIDERSQRSPTAEGKRADQGPPVSIRARLPPTRITTATSALTLPAAPSTATQLRSLTAKLTAEPDNSR